MSSPLNTDYKMGNAPAPGMIDSNSLRPPGDKTYDWATWKQSVTRAMAQNIGSGVGAGYPQGWDLNKLGSWDADIGAGQYVSASTVAKLGSYLDTYRPGTDSWIDQHFPMPTRTGNEYVETPEAYAKRIAIEQWQATYGLQQGAAALDQRQQDFAEKKFAIELALDNAARQSSTRAAGYSSGGFGGGGGGGGGGTDELALIAARGKLEMNLLNRRLEVETLWKEADDEFRKAQLAQDNSQFHEQMGYQRERDLRVEQMERGKTVSQLLSNPGDTVNAQYFLRSGANATQADMPKGTPIDIFTGQQMGTAPMTFSELHKQNTENAGLAAAQAAVTSSTGIATPMYAEGTEITEDGWTRAPQFISGDPHPSDPDGPNPEMVELRVVNGEPQAKVTRLSEMLQYAEGTNAPAIPTTTGTPAVPTTISAPATPRVGQTGGSSYLDRQRAGRQQQQEQFEANRVPGISYGGGYDINSPYGWMGSDGIDSHSEAYVNPETGQQDYRQVSTMSEYGQSVRGGLYDQHPGDSTFGSTRDPETGAKTYHYTDAKGNITGYAPLTGAQVSNGVTQSWNPSLQGYAPPAGFPTGAPAGMTGGTEDYPNTQEEQVRRFGGYIDIKTGQWVPVMPGDPLAREYAETPGAAPAMGAPNEGGYRTVETGGTYTAGPGLVYTVRPGDVIGPSGEVLTYNTSLGGSWMHATATPTFITSPEEFHALPPDVKQAILSGQPTSYVMAPGERNPDWLSGMFNPQGMAEGGGAVPLGPDGQPLPYYLPNPRATVPMSRLVAGMGTMDKGQAGFTLTENEQVFDPAIEWDYNHPMNFRTRGYDPNESEFSYFLRNNSDLGGVQFRPDGSVYSNERLRPVPRESNVTSKRDPQQPETPVEEEPTGGTGTGGTGTGTGGTGTGTGGTGTGTPIPGSTGGTGGVPAGGTGTGTGTGGIGANTYDPETYRNLPIVRYLMGEISEEEYNQLSSMGVEVPGMGITLPGVNSLNFSQLLNASENDPLGFALLNSLFTAGGVPISGFFNQLKSRAPLGTAFDPSMITSG